MAGPELKARLSMDDSSFQATMRRASNTASTAARGIAAAFSVGAITSFAKKMLDSASAIKDGADALDITTDKFQQFSFAIEQGGGSAEAFTAALTKINGLTQDAIGGNEKAAASFATLGVSLSDLQTMTPDEIMLKFADALQQGGASAQELAAFADIVGGKLVNKLVPALKDGSAAFLEMANSAKIMSGETVSALEEMGDNIEAFKKTAMNGLANFLLDFGNTVGDVIVGNKVGSTSIIGERSARDNAEREKLARADANEKAKQKAARDAEIKKRQDAIDAATKDFQEKFIAKNGRQLSVDYTKDGSVQSAFGKDKDAAGIIAEQDAMAAADRANRLRTRTNKGSAGRGGGSSSRFIEEAKRGSKWGALGSFATFKDPMISGARGGLGSTGGLTSGIAEEARRKKIADEKAAKKNEKATLGDVVSAINQPAWAGGNK